MDSPEIARFIFNSLSTALQQLTIRKIRSIEILLPPHEEQKEIVEILDQAFESIEEAKANIKKNIENAKELLLSQREIFSINYHLTNESNKAINDLCLKIFAGGDKPKDFSKTKTLNKIFIYC